ncbi:MAG: type II secretion system protein, partial [Leifsonia sp.]
MASIRILRRPVPYDRDLAQAGVTMVELMITIFVFSIFLAVVLSSLVGITK